MYVKNGVGRLEQVLLSLPNNLREAKQINEIAKKWQMQEIDEQLVLQEFYQLQNLYQQLGVTTNVLTTTKKSPHMMFARDLGGCVKEGYVLGKFKYGIRQTESVEFKTYLEQLAIPLLGEIEGEGLFEGGDFAFLNEQTIAVGLLDRTNESGFAQLQTILEPLGYSLHAVRMKPEYLHLDMCFNLVTEDTAIGFKKGLSTEFLNLLERLGIELIEGKEADIFRHGYNVQALGENRVLSLAQNKKINAQMRAKGIEVYDVHLSETLKLGGGIHCMTFPLKRI